MNIRHQLEVHIEKIASIVPFSRADVIFRLLDKQAKSILDVGCGDGRIMRQLRYRKPGIYAVGVDIFTPSLEKAKSKKSHHEFIHADVRKMSVRPKTFDVCLCHAAIEHLEKGEGLNLIEELERIAHRQVIVVLPVGFMPRGEHDGNLFERHRSGWSPDEFRKLGYRVKTDSARVVEQLHYTPLARKFFGLSLWGILTYLARPVGVFFPGHALTMTCTKRVFDDSTKDKD